MIPKTVEEAKRAGWPVYRQVAYFSIAPNGVQVLLPKEAHLETAFNWRKKRKSKNG